MANQFLTLADLTAMQHADPGIGAIIDIVRTLSPEFDTISGRPIDGINTYITRRKELPGGKNPIGGTLFRKVGGGTNLEASKIEQILQECYYLDGQIQIDEALIKAQPKTAPEDILAMESNGQVKAKMIGLGQQFYQGLNRDANGFYGIQSFCDDSMVFRGASAAAGATESVYLVRNTLDGVHFVFGNGTGLQLGQPMRQQVVDPNDATKRMFAYVNNYSGYIGLSNNHPLSIARIGNLDNSGTAGTYITPKRIAQAYFSFPGGYPPTHIFMSRRQAFLYQASLVPVAAGNLTGWMPMNYPEGYPKESSGVKIHVTDNITLTETVIGSGVGSAAL